jgi:hypothetical protein
VKGTLVENVLFELMKPLTVNPVLEIVALVLLADSVPPVKKLILPVPAAPKPKLFAVV